MLVRRPRKLLKFFLTRFNSNSSRIISECFLPSEKSLYVDTEKMPQEERSLLFSHAPVQYGGSFHARVAGGFNGQLAKLYERHRAPEETIQLHSELRRSGVALINTLSYNYLLAAYLRLRRFEDAFKLVLQMEAAGLRPDRMTFEILLHELSFVNGMERAVDELFEAMQAKWSIRPTEICWRARITTWIHKKTVGRAVEHYKAMLKDERLIQNGRLHGFLLRLSITRKCWPLADQIVQFVADPASKISGGIPTMDLFDYTQSDGLYLDYRAIPTIHFIIDQLGKSHSLDEGTCVKLLYFAYRCGKGGSKIADYAMDRLLEIYEGDSKVPGSVQIPLHFVETYLETLRCDFDPSSVMEGETTGIQPQAILIPDLTPKIQTRIELFQGILQQTSRKL